MRFRLEHIHIAWAKRAIIAAAGAALVCLALWWASQSTVATETALDRVKSIPFIGWIFGLLLAIPITGFKSFLSAHPYFTLWIGFSIFFFGGFGSEHVRRLLHYRLWPDRPFFFRPRAPEHGDRRRMDGMAPVEPLYKLTDFVGRLDELKWLRDFALSEKPFAWATIHAPPGRGKSRLAQQWCEEFEALGWDAAFFDETAKSFEEVDHWVPRRKTILVVDEAERYRDRIRTFTLRFNASASRSHPIRLLFLDHMRFSPDLEGAAAGAYAPSHYALEPMAAGDELLAISRECAPELSNARRAEIVAAAQGEPLSLLLLLDANLGEAGPIDVDLVIARKSEQVVKRLAATGDEVRDAFLLNCLAPGVAVPKDQNAIDGLFPHGVGGPTLPPYKPDILADTLALKGLADLTGPSQAEMARRAWAADPAAMAYGVRRMWLNRRREAAHAAAALQGNDTAGQLDEPGLSERRHDAKWRGHALALLTQRPGETPETVSQTDRQWLFAVQDIVASDVSSPDAKAALTGLLDQAFAAFPELKEIIRLTTEAYEQAMELVYAIAGDNIDALQAAKKALERFVDAWPAGPEKALIFAKGAVNAILHYGTAAAAGREAAWPLMAEAETCLSEGYGRFRDDPRVALEYTMGAINAIHHYGTAAAAGREAAWPLMAEAETRLSEVYGRFRDDLQIALEYIMGAVNAIAHYGTAAVAGREAAWPLMVEAETRLSEGYGRFRDNPQIALEYAMGAVNAIYHYGAAAVAGREAAWPLMVEAETRLSEVYGRFRDDRQIALELEYAKGAVNAIYHYGAAAVAGREAAWPLMVEAETRLREVYGRFRDDPQIALEYAKGRATVISYYGTAAAAGREAAWPLVAEAETRLSEVYGRFRDDPQIARRYAMGAVNAINQYGTAAAAGREAAWPLMAEAETRLSEVYRRFRDDPQIALEYAMGAVNAIGHYGTAAAAGREAAWPLMAEAETRLSEGYGRFRDNPQIARRYAMGALNAIIIYGKSETHAEHLHAARQRLVEVVSRWRLDKTIGAQLMGYARDANLLDQLTSPVFAAPKVTVTASYQPAPKPADDDKAIP